jgi:hypothetical protein
MLDKSYYHGQQGQCFQQLEKYFEEIKHEFDSQPNKIFLDPEDFSDSVRGLPDDFDDKSGDYVHGQWKALGVQSGKHEGQSFNDYPMLYSILRKFPYKTNVAIMTVGPDTKIGNHTDNEGGWRYQLCIDAGGGTDSGMYYMDIETKKKALHIWKSGDAFVFQPDLQLHNGYNNNPGERTTLLIDFYKESLYTKEKFEAYYQHYNDEFEGLENLADVYESRKQKK